MLGVGEYWKKKTSPLSLTYLPVGNKIIFRGADYSGKIKSIKMSKFTLAFLWVEELSEFKIEEELSTIEKSVLRAELPEGLFYLFYYSYNLPKRKQSWEYLGEPKCENEKQAEEIRDFIKNVKVNSNQRSLNQFIESYLDQLIECGNSTGEIVLNKLKMIYMP